MKAIITSIDEEFQKARKLGSKDLKPRKHKTLGEYKRWKETAGPGSRLKHERRMREIRLKEGRELAAKR